MQVSLKTLRVLASLGDWDAKEALAEVLEEGRTSCSALRLIGVPPDPWEGW